jgi:hypothetical protein
MLRQFLSALLPWFLAAAVLLGACPECQPRQVSGHSCCDPEPQPAPRQMCPDRNEILRNYEKPPVTDVTVSLVAAGPAPRIEIAAAPGPARTMEIQPRAESPPDLFLRHAAILI